MSLEPFAVMEPSAWPRKKAWATPVPAKAYRKPKKTVKIRTEMIERRSMVIM
jgi:hypothetical protein